MAHLLSGANRFDWSSFLKHDGCVCMPRLHERPIGVGDAGGLDQFLLGDLGAEIATVGRPLGSDDG
jgi:hypothetical protein